jgi:hypothetical protein
MSERIPMTRAGLRQLKANGPVAERRNARGGRAGRPGPRRRRHSENAEYHGARESLDFAARANVLRDKSPGRLRGSQKVAKDEVAFDARTVRDSTSATRKSYPGRRRGRRLRRRLVPRASRWRRAYGQEGGPKRGDPVPMGTTRSRSSFPLGDS